MPEHWDYFDRFRERLAHVGAETVVIGALAALRYRNEPRATTDVDFLVTSLDGVADALVDAGCRVRTVTDDDGAPYVVFARGDGVQVDALLAETEYQLVAHRRAVDGFLTVEDVIVHKLIAWRPRDRDDIESILSVGHDLDVAYIERWADTWDVTDRWRSVTNPAS
ncbi:hypothetical protein BH23ACT3_BH23ACT3_23090 [soil metagenome]